MAICVRVVLPSDELVRIKCLTHDATVGDLVQRLAPHVSAAAAHRDTQQQQTKTKKTREGHLMQVFPLSATDNHRVAKELGRKSSSSLNMGWELIRVRTGTALERHALVWEALGDLDILEYRPVGKSLERGPVKAHARPTKPSSPESVQQQVRARSNSSFSTRPPLRKTGLYSKTRKRKLKLPASARSSVAASEASTVLLRGGMQLLDQLEAIEAEVSALLLFVRDADARGGNCKTDELLPHLLRVFRVLFQRKQQQQQSSALYSSVLTRFPIEDLTQDLSRALKDAATESLRPPIAPVLMRGWVVCVEWGAFWRNSRRDYACLCDDGVLSFFTSEKQCSEYLFALIMARNSSVNGSKLALSSKTSAPQSQIDLTDRSCGWVIRKGDANPDTERHAFALFERRDTLRLIMDVGSDDEANDWLAAIGAELRHCERLDNVQTLYDALLYPRESSKAPGEEPLAFDDRSTQLKLPLRWLHAQMERQHGRSARHQRLQCANLSQARKDFRRDRLTINGSLHCPAAGVDTLLLALTAELLKTLAPVERRKSGANEAEPLEMVALRLAKELLVCSARTDGGGDILDALHLVFPSDRFSICPRASEMAPIAVSLSALDCRASEPATPVTEIEIRMSYWVIPSGAVGEELPSCGNELLTKKTINKSSMRQSGDDQKLEVVGTFSRKLVGDFCKWHEVDGHVNLEFLQNSLTAC